MMETFGPVTVGLLLLMIAGIVETLKQFGVTGRWSLLASIVLGFLLALVFQLGELFPQISIWVQIVVYAVCFGLTAGGLFDLGKRFFITKQ
jgi:hypothetical protein